MKDIEYLLATKEIPSYTPDEGLAIFRKECELNGKNYQLTVAMEEFAELIEVLCENTIKGRVDIIHLKEELVDCWICLNYLEILFDIWTFPSITYYDKENCINNCILNLSTGITRFSKCIREKADADIKIIPVYTSIWETLYNIQKFYNLSNNDSEMERIRCLKIERCEQRNTAKIKSRENTSESIKEKLINTDTTDLSHLHEYTSES